VKYAARAKKGVYTLMKRWIPIPDIDSDDRMERFHCERTAVNYTIQGSAAEVLKMAMIELRKQGYLPLLTVHDELLFEGWCSIKAMAMQTKIKEIMESIVKLDVPLVAEVGIGRNWRTAKG
jgi:DNA polymerase-1